LVCHSGNHQECVTDEIWGYGPEDAGANRKEQHWSSGLVIDRFSRNVSSEQSFLDVFVDTESSHESGGGAAIGHLLVAYHVYIIWKWTKSTGKVE
jgi:hypothetical protein